MPANLMTYVTFGLPNDTPRIGRSALIDLMLQYATGECGVQHMTPHGIPGQSPDLVTFRLPESQLAQVAELSAEFEVPMYDVALVTVHPWKTWHDQPFNELAPHCTHPHYNVDPYGTAMHDISQHLADALLNADKMSDTEYDTLLSIAKLIAERDRSSLDTEVLEHLGLV